MTNEILEVLKREGFVEEDENTVAIDLFYGVSLQVWAHGTRVRAYFSIPETYDEVSFPNLYSEDVNASEYIGKILQLKNLLYAPDDDV